MTDLNVAYGSALPYALSGGAEPIAPLASPAAPFYSNPVAAAPFAPETVKANECSQRYHYVMAKMTEINSKTEPWNDRDAEICAFSEKLSVLADELKDITRAFLTDAPDTADAPDVLADLNAFRDKTTEHLTAFAKFHMTWTEAKNKRLAELRTERDEWLNESVVLRAFLTDAIRSLRATAPDAAADAPDAPADAPAPAAPTPCTICFTNAVNTAIVPCGHCFCAGCIKKHVGTLSYRAHHNCPTCRQTIQKTMPLFL